MGQFVSKLVATKFQKSPNLVTLVTLSFDLVIDYARANTERDRPLPLLYKTRSRARFHFHYFRHFRDALEE